MVKYILISSAILLTSCLKDDELLLIRKVNITNLLNLKGYYYNEYNAGTDFVEIYFLYSNGIILSEGSIEKQKLEERLNDISSGQANEKNKTLKYLWGVYELKDNVIKFERWYPSDRPYQTAIREGDILNDTTFVITKSYRPNGSNLTERNEVYKFKSFSPKPDSTNMFIK